MTKDQKLVLLEQVFSPASPIKEIDFFHGRINQLEKVAEAINKEGQHSILYGERGVGKTSLANIMAKSFTHVYPVKITCDKTDTFKTLWERAFEGIQFSKTTTGLGFNPETTTQIINMGNHLRGLTNVRPSTITNLLNSFGNFKMLFIFDEFDNVISEKAKSSFADLIKSLSDNNTNSTIVLVGIADSIESLIGNHQSLERCLKQIKMPRMRKDESEEIIEKGISLLGLKIDNKVKDSIVEFSSGFPHYVHLICEFGCRELIKNDKLTFSDSYLLIAIKSGIENTSEQLRTSYRKAILTSNSSSKWRDLLFACASSEIDEFNAFTISDVVKQYNKITNGNLKNSSSLNYNLNQLLTENRGEVLAKLGKGMSTRYMFKNPMMRAFVKLKIHSDK
jgi:AAA+ ATPase superfamily predicted ATPase